MLANSLKLAIAEVHKIYVSLAAQISNMFNLNDVCHDVGISHPSAEHWLSILQS
jgi:hypothetical protein